MWGDAYEAAAGREHDAHLAGPIHEILRGAHRRPEGQDALAHIACRPGIQSRGGQEPLRLLQPGGDVRGDAVDADLVEQVERGAHTEDGGEALRALFQLGRVLAQLEVQMIEIERILHALPAHHRRPNAWEDFAANVGDTDAGQSQLPLVAIGGQKIDVWVYHVDGE